MTTITTEVEKQKRDRRGRRITPMARRVELVAGYRASGLTMEQYARQEGINRLTLAKWCHLHGRGADAKTIHFAEVKLGAATTRSAGASASWAFEVTLPNGWVVRAADAAALAQLLHVAGR